MEIRPRARGLKLGAETEERGLVAEAGSDVNPDGQASLVPA